VADTIMLDGGNVSWECCCISCDMTRLEGCGDNWAGKGAEGNGLQPSFSVWQRRQVSGSRGGLIKDRGGAGIRRKWGDGRGVEMGKGHVCNC